MEALQQRLLKYRESADQAKQEGNGSKARRMGRIAKVWTIYLPAWNYLLDDVIHINVETKYLKCGASGKSSQITKK